MHKLWPIRGLALLLTLLLAGGLVGCTPFSADRQSVTYMDAFDTVSTVTAYGVDEDAFEADEKRLHEELLRYHRLYDIYNTYEGLINLKSINDAAGGVPVAVEEDILDLLEYGLKAYNLTDGRVNILFGPVLGLWHDSRQAAQEQPAAAALPRTEALQQAAAYVSPDLLHIDRAAGTVQLTDPAARLDVGAIAKGFAAERLAEFVAEELGWTSALLDIGGNIRAVGSKPGLGEGSPYTIGIRNPDTDSAMTYLMTVRLTDCAAVTSGDYQRYFTVDGQDYHHIIDVDTLFPATYARAVTVICPDSGLADVLSTALFTLPPEQGQRLLEQQTDAEALWVLPDGTVRYSGGFEKYIVT